MNRNEDWQSHEAPTRVGSKDKVYLGMTFAQIVAGILVSALAYALYQNGFVQSLGTVPRYWVIGVACVLIEARGRNILSVLWDIFFHILGKSRHEGSVGAYLEDKPQIAQDDEPVGYQSPHQRALSLFERKVLKSG